MKIFIENPVGYEININYDDYVNLKNEIKSTNKFWFNAISKIILFLIKLYWNILTSSIIAFIIISNFLNIQKIDIYKDINKSMSTFDIFYIAFYFSIFIFVIIFIKMIINKSLSSTLDSYIEAEMIYKIKEKYPQNISDNPVFCNLIDKDNEFQKQIIKSKFSIYKYF